MKRDVEKIRREIKDLELGNDSESLYSVYRGLIDAVIEDDRDSVIEHYEMLIAMFRKSVSAESLAFLSYTFEEALDEYTSRKLYDEDDENMVYMQEAADIMENIIDDED